MPEYGFDTICVHGGYTPDPATNSNVPPIYMTNAYTFNTTEDARAIFALEKQGNIYTRLGNPTCGVLEERIAVLEGGVGALATASGHSAMFMTLVNICSAGDEVVSSRAIYGGAVNLLGKTLGQLGIKVHFVDSDEPESFSRATNDKTRAWFIETIGNPKADLPDTRAIAALAHKQGVPLIADNTMATPYLLKPFELGADIVIHSTSKFLSGNGTLIGGCVVDGGSFEWKNNPRFPSFNEPDASYHGIVYADLGKTAFITKLRTHILRDIGAAQSPFNAFLTLCGTETLSLRMRKACDNSLAVAKYLSKHPKTEAVSYPSLEGSRYTGIAARDFPKGCGSVYTFDISGGREAAARFCDSLKLIPIVTNLGDSRTILSCPAATTHSQLSNEQLAGVGIKPGTIRLSIGIEDEADILADIEQGLKQV